MAMNFDDAQGPEATLVYVPHFCGHKQSRSTELITSTGEQVHCGAFAVLQPLHMTIWSAPKWTECPTPSQR